MDKICKLCNQVKEINKFKTYKQSGKEYRRHQCVNCWNKISRRAYKYRVKPSKIAEIILNTTCEICSKLFEDTRHTHVDHNHFTNEVRGLLCNNCNHLIGNCKENKNTLKSAIKYLKKYNG